MKVNKKKRAEGENDLIIPFVRSTELRGKPVDEQIAHGRHTGVDDGDEGGKDGREGHTGRLGFHDRATEQASSSE